MVFSDKFHKFNYLQLIRLGIHIGHSFRNTVYYASWLIYGFRKDISVINLFRFVGMMRLGFLFVDSAVSKCLPIWFITKDRLFEKYIRIAANRCGEFYSTIYWIRGMLSNYSVVSRTCKKVKSLSSLVRSAKHKLFFLNFKRWFFTRFRWPGLVYVSSVVFNYFVVNEASSSRIPCLAIADTDALVQNCTIPVPGNDDSIDCAIFYSNTIAEYVLYRKFVKVFIWFLFIRSSKRLFGFNTWVSIKNNLRSKQVFFFNSGYYPNYNFNNISLKFFFARDFWRYDFFENLSLKREGVDYGKITSFIADFFQSYRTKFLFLFEAFFFRVIAHRGKLFLRKARWRKFKMQKQRVLLRLDKLKLYKFRRDYFLNKIFFLNDKLLGVDCIRIALKFIVFVHFFFFRRKRFLALFKNRFYSFIKIMKKRFLFFFFLGIFKMNRFFFKSYSFLHFGGRRNFNRLQLNLLRMKNLSIRRKVLFFDFFRKGSYVFFWNRPFFDFFFHFSTFSFPLALSHFWVRTSLDSEFYNSLRFLPKSLLHFSSFRYFSNVFFSELYYRRFRNFWSKVFFWDLSFITLN